MLASSEPFSLPIDTSYKLLLSLSVYHNITLPSCFDDISLLYFASFGTMLFFSIVIDSIWFLNTSVFRNVDDELEGCVVSFCITFSLYIAPVPSP